MAASASTCGKTSSVGLLLRGPGSAFQTRGGLLSLSQSSPEAAVLAEAESRTERNGTSAIMLLSACVRAREGKREAEPAEPGLSLCGL